MKRVLLGGILAGLALFAWGAVSHMALPLGEAGVLSMPADREGAVVEAMKGAMSERALYFFPGMSRQPTPEEQKAWEERVARGPWGIVAYNPGGGAGMSPRPLAIEILFDVLAGLVAALALTQVAPAVGFARRVLVVTAFGVFATLAIDGSYWNWYGFPTSYFLAQLVDGVVGAALAGLVLARLLRPARLGAS
ncbi:MAG TPA: hypothetical protein VLL75_02040 [Vicinamibacteria bacterium]|nr:hypothetical protein [Vicinamibacteria bacterium]